MSARSPGKRLASLLALPLLLAAGFTGALYLFQESMIFVGTKLPDDHRFQFDVPFTEVTIPVDGAELNALHFQQPAPRGLVFFLHGNAGNLESWTSNIKYYQQVNYDLFIFDYRGYGKSTGRIESEQQLHNDVRAAWDAIAPGYRDKPVVVYGRSLGTALAARLARDVNPDLVMLVSPFTSMTAMAKQQYPFLPGWLVRYPLRTDRLIAEIRAPIVLVHGTEDELIPLSHSSILAELARTEPRLIVVPGAGHNDIHRFADYLEGVTAALPAAKTSSPGSSHE